MPQVQLTEQLSEVARKRASEAGFGSVDEYVADVLREDSATAEFEPARFFTPTRLAELDAAAADVLAGRVLTSDQLDAHLAERRAEWMRENRR